MLMSFTKDNNLTNNCLTAVAPIIEQGALTFEATGTYTGSTFAQLASIPVGNDAPYGGVIHNKGCNRIKVRVEYLEGDDCNTCTSQDTLTRVAKEFCIEADATYEVPEGFWASINVHVGDINCAPVDLVGSQKQQVYLHSAYKPVCPSCKVLVPA